MNRKNGWRKTKSKWYSAERRERYLNSMERRKKDKANLYWRVRRQLYLQGINPAAPGFELLLKGTILYWESKDKISRDTWYEMLNKTMLVPALKKDKETIERGHTPAEQWTKEALHSIGIKMSPYKFIQTLL